MTRTISLQSSSAEGLLICAGTFRIIFNLVLENSYATTLSARIFSASAAINRSICNFSWASTSSEIVTMSGASVAYRAIPLARPQRPKSDLGINALA
jgi:hypothetical protein